MFSARGFTLIEVLVVILIAGLLVGIATLSVGVVSGSREAEEQARRFAALVRLARDEAMFTQADFGVFVTPEGFRFSRFDEDAERWLEGDEMERRFRPRVLENTTLDLTVEGRPLVLAGRATNDRRNPEPELLLMASGEMTPFVLTWRWQAGSTVGAWVVHGDGVSELAIDAQDSRG